MLACEKDETKSIDERRSDYKSIAAGSANSTEIHVVVHAVVTAMWFRERQSSSEFELLYSEHVVYRGQRARDQCATSTGNDRARRSRLRSGCGRSSSLGVVLRLIALGYKSFWIDEIASVAIARRASPVFWHFLWHDEGNMAAYYVLLRPWLHFGYGEGMVRLLSVIPGVLSIPLMYVLGRRLFGRAYGTSCGIVAGAECRAQFRIAGGARVQLCRAGGVAVDLSFRAADRSADVRHGVSRMRSLPD